MPPPSPHAPIEAIREAARRAVAETSLRAVARSIPMSPMGLQHFVNGTRPYRSTLRKLTAWYVNRGASRGEFSEETARAALAILLDGIPDEQQAAVRAALVERIVFHYQQARTELPLWLQTLRAAEPPAGGSHAPPTRTKRTPDRPGVLFVRLRFTLCAGRRPRAGRGRDRARSRERMNSPLEIREVRLRGLVHRTHPAVAKNHFSNSVYPTAPALTGSVGEGRHRGFIAANSFAASPRRAPPADLPYPALAAAPAPWPMNVRARSAAVMPRYWASSKSERPLRSLWA